MSTVHVGFPTWIELREFQQHDGTLVPVEFLKKQDVPFEPKRMFYIRDIPEGEIRGNHAHKKCKQLIIAIAGSFHATVTGRAAEVKVVLNNPKWALYVPELNWVLLEKFTKGTICLVLASESYDVEDYINDHSAFLKATQIRGPLQQPGGKSSI